jgi:hypothetical protein
MRPGSTMNIAIMVNGEFRWFESFRASFIRNFQPALEGHNVQYFAHFWDHGLEKLPEFMNVCKPMILDLEGKKSDTDVRKYLGITKTINGTLPNQTYCAHRVFLLLEKYQKEHNMRFDLYIRMRPDLAFPEKINFDDFDNESIYFKRCHPGTTTSTFLCDFSYFTKNYSTVEKMAEFGMCLDAILDDPRPLDYKEFISENIYCPEEMLARHVSRKGLSPKLHNFELDLARNRISL